MTDWSPEDHGPAALREPPARRANYVQHAREMLNLPPEWDWFKMARVGPDPEPPAQGVGRALQVTGAVCEAVYTRGKRKGSRNWSKRDRTTEYVVTISDGQHSAWIHEWEGSTGLCARCEGTGRTLRSAGVSGRTYTSCARCIGTGIATRQETAESAAA